MSYCTNYTFNSIVFTIMKRTFVHQFYFQFLETKHETRLLMVSVFIKQMYIHSNDILPDISCF